MIKDIDNKVEINARIASCIPVMSSLDVFWKKAECTEKWKLMVFNAVIVSKLIYGLESLQFHSRTFHRLDTFQMRGIRKILGIPPTFIDREFSDEKVLEKANAIITENGIKTNVQKIIKLSSLLEKRRKTLLGHIIRAEDSDITRN